MSRELAEANKRLDAKSNQIIDSTNELNTAQKKLIVANHENSRLQNELYKQVTGDNAAPVTAIEGNERGNGQVYVTLNNPTLYPMSNITVSKLEWAMPTTANAKQSGYPDRVEKILVTDLTLVPNEKGHRIDEIVVTSFDAKYQKPMYRIKWRNGFYECTIDFEVSGGRAKVEMPRVTKQGLNN